MGREIYALMGVDVETDVGSFTPFHEGTQLGTPKLLDLFDATGMKGTFYTVGQTAKDNPNIAKLIVERGHEIGCHSLYHETVGDPLFDLPGVTPLLSHEVLARLRIATDWIEEASGVRPVSFRAPRLWGSTAVTKALMKLGYLTDASYPMYFYRERFSPYFVDPEDWTKEGDSDLVEIPNFADMTMESSDSPLERDRDQWPLFRTQGAEALLERVFSYLDFCAERDIPPYLAFYIHPWEFYPMAESYNFGEATVIPDEFITKNCGDYALEQLEIVIRTLQDEGVKFVTAEETYGLLKSGSLSPSK